jgi:hypothetical protein
MTKAEIIALTERCEGATAEEQRDLLILAAQTLRPEWFKMGKPTKDIEAFVRWCAKVDAEAYESAAMTLVPGNALTWHVGKHLKTGEGQAYILAPGRRDPHYVVATTPALALTSASLRAIAEGMEE